MQLHPRLNGSISTLADLVLHTTTSLCTNSSHYTTCVELGELVAARYANSPNSVQQQPCTRAMLLDKVYKVLLVSVGLPMQTSFNSLPYIGLM